MAVLTVQMAGLAPAAAQALGVQSGGWWVEICSAEGTRWMPFGTDREPAVPGAAHVLEHCPYCTAHAPVLGAPPAPLVRLLSLAAGSLVAQTLQAPPPKRHEHARALPRAPPLRA